jgi:hypothetical protein
MKNCRCIDTNNNWVFVRSKCGSALVVNQMQRIDVLISLSCNSKDSSDRGGQGLPHSR